MNGLGDPLVRDSQGCVLLMWGVGQAYSIEVLEESKTHWHTILARVREFGECFPEQREKHQGLSLGLEDSHSGRREGWRYKIHYAAQKPLSWIIC